MDLDPVLLTFSHAHKWIFVCAGPTKRNSIQILPNSYTQFVETVALDLEIVSAAICEDGVFHYTNPCAGLITIQ